MIVLNLPREEWYKIENVILAGIIPGPNEPKGNINSSLSPLVEDLKSFHDGIVVRSPKAYLSLTTIRAILICVMCDLPAARKVCGYTNFNGKKGCSKCMKEFPSTGDKIDYSGFDCDTWTSRNS